MRKVRLLSAVGTVSAGSVIPCVPPPRFTHWPVGKIIRYEGRGTPPGVIKLLVEPQERVLPKKKTGTLPEIWLALMTISVAQGLFGSGLNQALFHIPRAFSKPLLFRSWAQMSQVVCSTLLRGPGLSAA